MSGDMGDALEAQCFGQEAEAEEAADRMLAACPTGYECEKERFFAQGWYLICPKCGAEEMI